jgi:hypothetical protein
MGDSSPGLLGISRGSAGAPASHAPEQTAFSATSGTTRNVPDGTPAPFCQAGRAKTWLVPRPPKDQAISLTALAPVDTEVQDGRGRPNDGPGGS